MCLCLSVCLCENKRKKWYINVNTTLSIWGKNNTKLNFRFICSVQQIEPTQTSQDAVFTDDLTLRVQPVNNSCIKTTFVIATSQRGTACKIPTPAEISEWCYLKASQELYIKISSAKIHTIP